MLTPRQLIDICRATDKPLPSGRKIAEVVERMEEEILDIQHDLAFEAESNRYAKVYIDELKQELSTMKDALGEALEYIPEFTVGHSIVAEAIASAKEGA